MINIRSSGGGDTLYATTATLSFEGEDKTLLLEKVSRVSFESDQNT
jgi:hypothetical protein